MKLINSVCTSVYFPKSRKSIDEFRKMACFLAEMGIEYIEFYHDGDGRDKTGNALDEAGLKGVYIAVIPSKETKLHLCDEDETRRKEAVKLIKNCIDEAQYNGIKEVMLNSGRIGKSVKNGLDALAVSVEELYGYAVSKNYDVQLLLEPGDTHMDACQLVGPYLRTLEFTKRMNDAGFPLRLTMDSAHTVEEGEDFLKATAAVKQYCSHIHFANCNTTDAGSPFYGDKHIGYEYPDSDWTVSKLEVLFEDLKSLYPGDGVLRIGLEVLCREDDPYKYFSGAWNSLKFLHK